jgi:hypothetical protein
MPEKWDQLKELFTLALERDPGERSDFLRQACAGDDSLRSEIESWSHRTMQWSPLPRPHTMRSLLT